MVDSIIDFGSWLEASAVRRFINNFMTIVMSIEGVVCTGEGVGAELLTAAA